MDRENRKAVLAADVQSAIDALGWTSAQAAATLDVPEEMMSMISETVMLGEIW